MLNEPNPDVAQAESALGYRLAGIQVAVEAWSDDAPEALSRLLPLLRRTVPTVEDVLVAAAGELQERVWLRLRATGGIDVAQLDKKLNRTGLRIAIGRPGEDLDGFRATARTAARVKKLSLSAPHAPRVLWFDDVAPLALLSDDPQALSAFVAATLGRFKTDDRDCAALTYLARQGRGRHYGEESAVDALRAAVRHRRGLVTDRKVAQQRLHAQLNALCPSLSAPAGHGRALPVASPTGLAVLGCAAAFAGRPPRLRSLMARAPGRMTHASAEYWVHRWRGCLSPPADAERRARRLDRDLHRYRALQSDITSLDAELTELLAAMEGQILTTLPGVAVTRAAAFAAFSLPIARFPDAEHLYSATGLAPALYSRQPCVAVAEYPDRA